MTVILLDLNGEHPTVVSIDDDVPPRLMSYDGQFYERVHDSEAGVPQYQRTPF